MPESDCQFASLAVLDCRLRMLEPFRQTSRHRISAPDAQATASNCSIAHTEISVHRNRGVSFCRIGTPKNGSLKRNQGRWFIWVIPTHSLPIEPASVDSFSANSWETRGGILGLLTTKSGMLYMSRLHCIELIPRLSKQPRCNLRHPVSKGESTSPLFIPLGFRGFQPTF